MITTLPVGDLIFLGTGTSHGVPMMGCQCEVCLSADSRNRRLRSSVILGVPEGNLLIDTSPDLRQQFLREKLSFADAILYTHPHVDHLFGLDDTRLFPMLNGRETIPVYASQHVTDEIRTRFAYIFDPRVQEFPAGGIPKLTLNVLEPYQETEILGQKVLPLTINHGLIDIFGFRIGNLAYCTDAKVIPPESMRHLYGLETLIIGCLRYDPHPTHMGLSEAMEIVNELKPRRVFFTHIGHRFEHGKLCEELPPHIRPAYDGLYLRGCF